MCPINVGQGDSILLKLQYDLVEGNNPFVKISGFRQPRLDALRLSQVSKQMVHDN